MGSGTAGSVIAHRLATETNYTFIVLEAGGKGIPLFDIPVLGPLLHGSIYDWRFETVPQENACLAMNNKVSTYLFIFISEYINPDLKAVCFQLNVCTYFCRCFHELLFKIGLVDRLIINISQSKLNLSAKKLS